MISEVLSWVHMKLMQCGLGKAEFCRGAKNFFVEEDVQEPHHHQSGVKQEVESQVLGGKFYSSRGCLCAEG